MITVNVCVSCGMLGGGYVSGLVTLSVSKILCAALHASWCASCRYYTDNYPHFLIPLLV